jgi:hypothetical protein
MNFKNIVSWVLRLVAVAILLQTLYFKFTGQPESIALFTKLGIEPFGRLGIGVMELIASILLIIPATVFFGAFLGFGLMGGAIFSHLTVLGIESNGDGGELFMLAVAVLICCLIISILHKDQGIGLLNKFVKPQPNK